MLGATVALPLSAEPFYLDGQGLAIRGYDPVNYFTENLAIKGSIEHEFENELGLWRFETAANLDRFRKSPDLYMPEYGGFCAEGMARGFKRATDPTVWVMAKNKLYLHYSIASQNLWADDVRGNIRLADENWPKIKDFL